MMGTFAPINETKLADFSVRFFVISTSLTYTYIHQQTHILNKTLYEPFIFRRSHRLRCYSDARIGNKRVSMKLADQLNIRSTYFAPTYDSYLDYLIFVKIQHRGSLFRILPTPHPRHISHLNEKLIFLLTLRSRSIFHS